MSRHTKALVDAARAAVAALTLGATKEQEEQALVLLSVALKPFDAADRPALAWQSGRDSISRFFYADFNKSRYVIRKIDDRWWVRFTPRLGERALDLGAAATLKHVKAFCGDHAAKVTQLKMVTA